MKLKPQAGLFCLQQESYRRMSGGFMPLPNRHMKVWLILCLVLCVSAAVAVAPDETIVLEMAKQTHISANEIRQDYNACDSGVTLSMKICGSYKWMVEDARLNKTYKQALAKARVMGYESSLIRSQRAWMVYRDAACIYEGEMGAGGGSAEGLYVLSCKLDLTKLQADRLENSLRE